MASIGQDLKRERELRGVSLEEIASSTRISLRNLTALEGDQLDQLPGPFFIKGILRAYAKSIGLDEDAVLNKYEEMTHYSEMARPLTSRQRKIPTRLSRRTKLIIVLAFLLVLVLVAISILVFSPSEPSAKAPQEQRVSSSRPELKPIPPPAEEPEAEEVKGLTLELSFLEETWIQVYADQELQLEGLKQAGEKASIRALQELVVNLGNAGGVNFTLNGKKSKPFGSRGAVIKNIRITPDNMAEFILPEEWVKRGIENSQ